MYRSYVPCAHRNTLLDFPSALLITSASEARRIREYLIIARYWQHLHFAGSKLFENLDRRARDGEILFITGTRKRFRIGYTISCSGYKNLKRSDAKGLREIFVRFQQFPVFICCIYLFLLLVLHLFLFCLLFYLG